MNYALAATSLAHTYGNITSFITEYLRQLFPKNYFRTVHISSSIAYKQFNIFQNTNKEFLKKNKPIMIIRPRIELNDQDNFLFGTYLTQRITDNYMDIDIGNLQDFFEDKSNRKIKYLLNRLRMFFDVTIVVESQMEQINQAQYIKNRVRQEHNFFLQTALESYVPRELLALLAEDAQVPLYDESNNVKQFLDYVNSNSFYPVTYKLKNSTGNDEFFRYYPVNIDTTISGLSIDDGSKRGFISDSFGINFTVSTEFNASGLYYYFTDNKELIKEIDLTINSDTDKIIPLFTISNLFDIKVPDGWSLYSSILYGIDETDVPDLLDLSQILNTSLIKVIEYHRDKGVPMNTFIKFNIMKDNVMLDENSGDYSVDYEKLILTTFRTNTISSYRIIIHVNTLYINSLIKDVYGFNEEL